MAHQRTDVFLALGGIYRSDEPPRVAEAVTAYEKVLKLDPPPKRQAGRKVGSVQELVQVLHNEAKVI